MTVKIVALAAAGVFIYINYRGSSETGKIGAILTVAQMLFVSALGASEDYPILCPVVAVPCRLGERVV